MLGSCDPWDNSGFMEPLVDDELMSRRLGLENRSIWFFGTDKMTAESPYTGKKADNFRGEYFGKKPLCHGRSQ